MKRFLVIGLAALLNKQAEEAGGSIGITLKMLSGQ